ncbi:MAG: efflux RND transporter periplasmic adaptor subunit [Bacteroidales bacterium]
MSDAILAWLELEHRILKAKRPIETAFAAVNLANGLVPYRQAALWSVAEGIVALSGNATVDTGSPYVLWLNQVFTRLIPDCTTATALGAADLPAKLAEQWGEWLPPHALVLPTGRELLLFARDEAFGESDVLLLERLADLVRLSRQALAPKGRAFHLPSGRKAWALAALAAVALFFPVTGSVLAPAESVAAHPVLVRAPLDGVVDKVAVQPNESVAEGQLLFELDATTLAGRLDVARQQQATADAEYRQVAQAMVFDAKAKAQVAILAGKAEEKAAEVRLLESQIARIQVKAPGRGIALFDDPNDWIGKPVAVGEKVMAVADDGDTEVEAWVSVADVGEVRPGGTLTLFLNVAPLSPLKARVRSVAYEGSARPDATIAHRVRATLADGQVKPRLGLKGTARIDGDTVPLVWWLFRRPLAAIRQFVGV